MTETKKSPNQIVKLALILFLVCAVVAGVLGVVNMFTKDRIAEQKRLATAMAYNEVLPWDGEYVGVKFDEKAFPTVDSVSQAGDKGYVVELTFSGAQGNITAAVGVDTDCAVTGVSIISDSETPSLGKRINEEDWRAQFVGATAGVALVKNGGTIEAITSATISSTAVTDAVNTAIDLVAGLG